MSRRITLQPEDVTADQRPMSQALATPSGDGWLTAHNALSANRRGVGAVGGAGGTRGESGSGGGVVGEGRDREGMAGEVEQEEETVSVEPAVTETCRYVMYASHPLSTYVSLELRTEGVCAYFFSGVHRMSRSCGPVVFFVRKVLCLSLSLSPYPPLYLPSPWSLWRVCMHPSLVL